MRHRTPDLDRLDIFGNLIDDVQAIGELAGDLRLRVGLLDKDKDGEEGDGFLGGIVRKDVVQDKLGEDKLMCRVDLWVSLIRGHSERYLTSHATLPLRRTVELSSMNLSCLSTSTRLS